MALDALVKQVHSKWFYFMAGSANGQEESNPAL